MPCVRSRGKTWTRSSPSTRPSRAGRGAPTSSGGSPPRCARRSSMRSSPRPTPPGSPATSSPACWKANSGAPSPACGWRSSACAGTCSTTASARCCSTRSRPGRGGTASATCARRPPGTITACCAGSTRCSFTLAPNHIVDCAVAGGQYLPERDDRVTIPEGEGPAHEIDYGGQSDNHFERLARDLADVRAMSPGDLAEISASTARSPVATARRTCRPGSTRRWSTRRSASR